MRRFLIAFLGVGVVLSGIVAAIYRQDRLHQQALLEREAQHVLDLHQELIEFELQAVQSDVSYLATQETLRSFLADSRSSRESLEREYANFARFRGVYDQIRILDTDGQEVVRVNCSTGNPEVVPLAELQSKASRYYFQEALALREGEVFISPFDLNIEHGQIERPIKPVIRFLAPVYDNAHRKRGVLVLNYLGAHLLAKLDQYAGTFRGDSMLINSAGEYIRARTPGHAWGWLLGHGHSFRSEFPEAWEHRRRLHATVQRLGGDAYAFATVPLGEGRSLRHTSTATADDGNANALIIVCHLSSAVASAHSKDLLAKLLLMNGGIMVVLAALLLYWARSQEVRRLHEQQISESERRLRRLSGALLAAQESERQSISRTLHDELGQHVTAISLDLRSLQRAAGDAGDDPLLRRAIEETDGLLKSLHEIATRVRPSVLDDLGLQDAVESFLADYQIRTGIDVTQRLRLDREDIPARVGENVYRILQEGLANVAAHGEVSRADVMIETDDRMLRMTLRDEGVGFRPAEAESSNRLGLLGMRERVELLHGRFDVQSAPGAGTRIYVSIPLRAGNGAIGAQGGI